MRTRKAKDRARLMQAAVMIYRAMNYIGDMYK